MNKFVTLDIETLGTPGDCGTTHVVMPSAAFVVWKGVQELPTIIYCGFDVREQLFQGAKVSAGTVAFWMKEAMSGNQAATTLISELNDKPLSGYQIWNSLSTLERISTTNEDIFKAIVAHMVFNKYDMLRYYGNGPDFDMTIYEANSYHANKGMPSVPWAFWNIRSARNAKEDPAFKEISKEAEVWAHRVFKEYNIISDTNHTPSKHNPIYDALVESFIIFHTLEN